MIAFAAVALRRLVRDRTNIFFVALFPLLLVMLIGVQFGGGEPVVRLAVVGDPAADPSVERIHDGLVAEGHELVEVPSVEDARGAVETGDVDAAVVLPTAVDVTAGRTAEVAFIANPDGSDLAVRTSVEAVVAAVASDLAAAQALVVTGAAPDLAAAQASLPDEVGFAVTATTVGGGGLQEEFAGLGQFDLGASSQLLLFVFVTALTGSGAIVQVRRFGVLDRVLSGPTAPATVIAGLGLGQLAVAAVQACIIVGATSLLFDVDWGDPVATGAVVVAFCLVAAAAGLLIGAVLRTEEQAGGVGVPVALTLAAVGGSMAPIEVLPTALQQLARFTPHGQGNLAFAEIVRRGGGLTDVATNLAALLAMALVLGTVAVVVLRGRLGVER